MKWISISLLVSTLLLFGVWIGVSTAEGFNPEKIEFAGSMNTEKALNPVTDTYTNFVYFPAVFRQYTVPTWQQFGLPGKRIESITLSPVSILYIGTYKQGLYVSYDAGNTWSIIDAGISISATISNIVIDPFDTQKMYLTSSYSYPFFFKSQDGGKSWIPGGATTHPPNILAEDTNVPGRLFSGDIPLDLVGGRVYKTDDSGINWTMVLTEQIFPTEIAVSSMNSGTIFVSSAKGMYRSKDGGDNWEHLTNGLPDTDVVNVVLHPVDSSIAYANAQMHIYKTTDGGDSWEVWGEDHPANGIRKWLINTDYPEVHYAIFGSTDIYISKNGGKQWQPFVNGLNSIEVNDLILDITSTYLYAGTQNGIWIMNLAAGDKQ